MHKHTFICTSSSEIKVIECPGNRWIAQLCNRLLLPCTLHLCLSRTVPINPPALNLSLTSLAVEQLQIALFLMHLNKAAFFPLPKSFFALQNNTGPRPRTRSSAFQLPSVMFLVLWNVKFVLLLTFNYFFSQKYMFQSLHVFRQHSCAAWSSGLCYLWFSWAF